MSTPPPVWRQEFLGMQAIFASPQMLALMEKVRRFAKSDASVLICGESGAGKEIVARALGHYSSRSVHGWVDVSCGAIPENLIESELFGYERGAFSGATQRKQGLFEIADKGTLFLDEIGELDLRLQVKLLRVLDTGEFYRLGGTTKIKVDVRILAATNQDLAQRTKDGLFRKDLFHRLAQLQIQVPPLRDRPEDIPALISHFLDRHCPSVRFCGESLNALQLWHWPGNVRELRNVVISSGALCEDGVIRPAELPEEIRPYSATPTMTPSLENLSRAIHSPPGPHTPNGGLLEAVERRLILQTLDQTGGHQERAAAILGISSRTLSRKLKSYATQLPA